ncbi:MAG TPA: hypothetical protein VKC63_12635 [Solirubrobacterales bacterium]|nr:hypothetical protein [Solirubrobacterales bacterium]
MSSRRALGGVAGFLCAAALVGGCGSGDSEPTPKSEYIEEADATCARQTRKIHRLIVPYTEGKGYAHLSAPEAKKMVRKVLAPALGYEVRSVRILVLPEKYVPRVLHFLDVWQQGVDKAEADPVAFIHAKEPFAEDERLAREFGFEICGSL